MPIQPLPVWGQTYQSTWEKVFKDGQGSGFNAKKATQEAWQKWNNDNAKSIQFIPPVPPNLPLQGTTKEKTFSPLDFTKADSASKSAQIIATAWQTWASSITWPMVPPAPPYSSISSVVTDPSSISAAYNQLYKALIDEMEIVPKDESGIQKKYKNIGKLFFTAASSLKVKVIGLGMGGPPPPLVISVPVL